MLYIYLQGMLNEQKELKGKAKSESSVNKFTEEKRERKACVFQQKGKESFRLTIRKLKNHHLKDHFKMTMTLT